MVPRPQRVHWACRASLSIAYRKNTARALGALTTGTNSKGVRQMTEQGQPPLCAAHNSEPRDGRDQGEALQLKNPFSFMTVLKFGAVFGIL